MTRTTLVIALALVACGKKDDKGGGGDKPAVTIDVAAVNALVPAALKDKLVFEKRDIVLERGKHPTTYTMAVPKGWTQESKMFGHMKGDDKAGFFTRLQVGSNCDGECVPKEWEKIADKTNFQRRLDKGKASKDVKGKGTRTMIVDVDANGVKTTDVVVAWWTDGAKQYYACEAMLDEAIKDAAPAFEKACSAVNINGDD